jgi:hypothetical protein
LRICHSPPTLFAALKFQKLTPSLSWQGQIVPPDGESSMTGQWQYQVRFDVNDSAVAESIRRKAPDIVLAQLFGVLASHRALAKCQFDAFAEYVAAAEEHGVESYPLYEWTKATIENPSKKEKYLAAGGL